MRILIKQALIVDPQSRHHNKRKDIFIRRGSIEKIGRGLSMKANHVIDGKKLCVSPGWCDIGTQIGEPGFEHRESIATVSRAAAAGGYTTLACFPNTNPAIDNRSVAEFVQNRSATTPVKIVPIGAITSGAHGKEISELQDVYNAGAVGFSDGRHPMSHAGIMLLALNYVKTFGGIIINRPFDPNLIANGQMHESVVSTSLGMRGLPRTSERIVLERDIRLLEYTESRLHVYGISASDSVTLVRRAAKSGHDITCSVPAANLLMTDDTLRDFETNNKVLPPLREEVDRKALIRGVQDGTITVITSNHEPLEEERKKLEFANADFGSTGLQTAFAMARQATVNSVELETLISCFNYGPRSILGLPPCTIEEGASSELTIFDPDAEWTFQDEDILSRSRNSAGLGLSLRGKVTGTIMRDAYHPS